MCLDFLTKFCSGNAENRELLYELLLDSDSQYHLKLEDDGTGDLGGMEDLIIEILRENKTNLMKVIDIFFCSIAILF